MGAGASMRENVRGALHDLTAVGLPDKAAPLTFYAALCVSRRASRASSAAAGPDRQLPGDEQRGAGRDPQAARHR